MSSKKGKGLINVGKLLSGMHGEAKGQSYHRCYESHPTIEFDNGEGKPVGILAGGNCSWPSHKDADVYVGLQSGMHFQNRANYPWEPKYESKVVEFQFTISDGRAPSNTPDALKLIEWICNQLRDGKKVHVGCIGGHGRTGMILSAVLKEMCQTEDAITWIRQNYCQKAVESSEQVDWLHKNYGIKKVKGSKEGAHKVSSHAGGKYPKYDPATSYTQKGGYAGYGSSSDQNELALDTYGSSQINKVSPVGSSRDVWKK